MKESKIGNWFGFLYLIVGAAVVIFGFRQLIKMTERGDKSAMVMNAAIIFAGVLSFLVGITTLQRLTKKEGGETG